MSCEFFWPSADWITRIPPFVLGFFKKNEVKNIFFEKNPGIICRFKNKLYLCIAIEKQTSISNSGCSAVRLAHLLWEQGVPGSNPGIPTKRSYNLVAPFLVSYGMLTN